MVSFDSSLAFYVFLLFVPTAFIYHYRYYPQSVTPRVKTKPADDKPLKTIMQAPRDDLAPPKDDPFTLEELKQYDGSNANKPIYVAIKGTDI
jgi:membrane-associated progesterone receptor component